MLIGPGRAERCSLAQGGPRDALWPREGREMLIGPGRAERCSLAQGGPRDAHWPREAERCSLAQGGREMLIGPGRPRDAHWPSEGREMLSDSENYHFLRSGINLPFSPKNGICYQSLPTPKSVISSVHTLIHFLPLPLQ